MNVLSRYGLAGVLALTATVNVAAASDKLKAYINDNAHRIVNDFREFLSLPNVSDNVDDMHENARWITEYIKARGFTSETVSAGGAPYIIAEKKTPGASKTILIYAHFDGQPVAPQNWASPPFEATLRDGLVETGGNIVDWPDSAQAFDPEWRIFARSAGDDKAPVIALMAAIDALDEAGLAPGVNIKLILDGEEEAGSPTLRQILDTHADKLSSDLLLFCDGPMHQSRQRQLVFGVRGAMTVHLTAFGPKRPLHSGHYGNWAPNPNDRLVHLLAKMKDEEARILVPGYLDNVRPISAVEQAAIDALPQMDEALRNELALGDTDGDGKRLEELIMSPAIVVKGFDGGGTGSKSRNIIMPQATASLNLRLVPDQTPESVKKALNTFFESEGYWLTNREPSDEELRQHEKVLKVDWVDGGYGAFRSDLNSPIARKLISILNDIDQKPTLLTPTMGGSLPIYLFEEALEAPIILLPIANHDNNQHGRNENLRLQNLWDAIEIYATILTNFGRDD
ncbi:M20/M25/M40 family metallo-hydrolase [Kordiimonas sp.]|uniref:M20/M25/M40 family metallo-hydrolase n=1 Tax=Kordiimonas sp. TaxID=1970157 RepID=UPI003A9316FE